MSKLGGQQKKVVLLLASLEAKMTRVPNTHGPRPAVRQGDVLALAASRTALLSGGIDAKVSFFARGAPGQERHAWVWWGRVGGVGGVGGVGWVGWGVGFFGPSTGDLQHMKIRELWIEVGGLHFQRPWPST